ncbi:MAG TPA: SMC-Scp complex subunit ScpB [Alteromonas sp.]|nr:SMC-Scp complex subunit ScpB [Alteromonas sp.]HCA76502.1 SMC-Scp complex subunit ScpB [Alteromonas sp.]HCB10337.1 SMC-Scp complex subunit ScpB [Alteromonas sp.]HCB16808.1 SMC-Scp complex subunit ScpB [Alteromonas sp.]HCL12951.1 SMC-Scp complex subunit ScpB [Alteromonas sp.]|tara:strand:+ start:12027 stop:12656 length:630 start_codon:yes stop_codon:yes gene_type:complete
MKKINSEQLKQLIEATIFVSDQPVSVDKLKNTVLADFTVSDKAIQSALSALQLDYRPRGIQLVEVASGYRFQSLDSLSPWLSRLWQETSPKYSRAMLETLALIAYRQPITRGEIEQVRGVAVSSNIIKTLTEREWIKVIGHKEVPGRPALYATTKQFLDYFSLKSLSDLPNAEDFMASLDATQNVTHVLHDEQASQAQGDSDNQKESIH